LHYKSLKIKSKRLRPAKVECLDVNLRTTLIAIQSMRNVNREKIGTLGFCQGGRYAFVANELLPLSAAVSYYAVGVDKIVSDASELHAPQLFFWGGRGN
jgi:carboxymethylenebutenolidase